MSTDLTTQELGTAATLFGTDNPAEALAQMTVVASTLADVVRKQNLVVRIQSTEHVRVEGWTFLGSLLGVFPVVEWTKPVTLDDVPVGWEARVEARTRAGEIVGAAEAECLRTERSWASRDDYALRSMAQTRAVSKALRLPLGFVMQLAGFNPTPAEEMTADLPVVDMSDPDIPFGDAPAEQLQPPKFISEKQRTRLWTIAEKAEMDEPALRAVVMSVTGQESTKKIRVGREYDSVIAALSSSGGPSGDHSGPDAGRSSPSSPAPVSGESLASPDEILELSARLIGASSNPQGAAYAIERHATSHSPAGHLAWLTDQEKRRFTN